jgi:uncharacterized protein (DUF58 family)
LDPLLVAKLATMEMRARAVAEGVLAGRHRSNKKGRSMEFSGHRPYTPTDDWRRIDWRAYARTDRWMVREEEQETNRRVLLLLDASASMGFRGGNRLQKSRYGAILSAALAYGLLRQGESVGAATFGGGLKDFVPLRAGSAQLPLILDLLDRAAPSGPTALNDALSQAAGRLGKRAWIVLVTDLWNDRADPAPALGLLRARHHDVSVLCPLDPLELDPDLEGEFLFKDVETGETLRASAEEARDRYRALAAERFARLDRALASLRIPLVRCRTDRPLDESLTAFLERVR